MLRTVPPTMRRIGIALPVIAALLAGCASSPTPPKGKLRVVAAENVWGSIASQLGGSRANVQSIITNPAQDPHSYEPTARDARTLATAQVVIGNGIGYDPWVGRLVAANPAPGRTVLTVGDRLGLREGDNPHRWYSPSDVDAVASAITADLVKLDRGQASYYQQRRRAFETQGLASYHTLIATIKGRYGGVPVGASESIFALQAPALGLRLLTPYSFMKAISEGTDVTAKDTLTTQRQITDHQIKVWIYNSQNATPGIRRLNALARSAHIPIATITETLDPAGASFEQWQVAQLQRIQQALHQATGR
jgi:zinc/manganese transport system substrate-binding protein